LKFLINSSAPSSKAYLLDSFLVFFLLLLSNAADLAVKIRIHFALIVGIVSIVGIVVLHMYNVRDAVFDRACCWVACVRQSRCSSQRRCQPLFWLHSG